jgi:3-hydroxyacyl-[acyl-carrier-protein] dehydratase
MRFLFYDNVTKMERSKSIVGIKTFTLSEEFLKGHFNKVALIPGVIFIEAMAQLLGWLIISSHDFKLSAIMSLIEGVSVPADLRPGFEAEIRGEIISTSKRDSLGKASIFIGGKLTASIDRIIYSHFHEVDSHELLERFRYYSGVNDISI